MPPRAKVYGTFIGQARAAIPQAGGTKMTAVWPRLELIKATLIATASLLVAAGPTMLAAQSGDALDLSGNWRLIPERSSCGEWNVDQYGQQRDGCAVPVDELPLNGRSRAWAEFFDEALSPMWDCAPASLPSLLGDPLPVNIDQRSDRVLIFYEHDEHLRTIWMDGRRHPPPDELFYYGHAIGRYEGDAFVVETANFTFDPDGLDDHGHLASSPRKRLTERYTRTGPESIELEITVEDSLFLTEPFTWTRTLRRSAVPPGEWGDCDPEQSRRQLEGLPSRYED